jgi:hypothetical protein
MQVAKVEPCPEHQPYARSRHNFANRMILKSKASTRFTVQDFFFVRLTMCGPHCFAVNGNLVRCMLRALLLYPILGNEAINIYEATKFQEPKGIFKALQEGLYCRYTVH